MQNRVYAKQGVSRCSGECARSRVKQLTKQIRCLTVVRISGQIPPSLPPFNPPSILGIKQHRFVIPLTALPPFNPPSLPSTLPLFSLSNNTGLSTLWQRSNKTNTLLNYSTYFRTDPSLPPFNPPSILGIKQHRFVIPLTNAIKSRSFDFFTPYILVQMTWNSHNILVKKVSSIVSQNVSTKWKLKKSADWTAPSTISDSSRRERGDAALLQPETKEREEVVDVRGEEVSIVREKQNPL